jgi:recombination protein RecA
MAFGPKETTTGGKALKFYSSLRLDVRRIASLKKQEVHVGNRIVVKVVKNKLAPPFKKAEVDLLFHKGICEKLDLLDAALQYGIIKKSGAWFSYEGSKISQGRDQAHAYLIDKPEEAQKIRAAVMDAIKVEQEQFDKA